MEQFPYGLGSSLNELRRLEFQSTVFENSTRAFLLRAGLKPGMRVLDVGSGTGGVAFIAAGIVGPTGSVVGIDISPEAVSFAKRRAADRQDRNLSFEKSDLATMPLALPFDAVIGRLILMHCKEPGIALSAIVRHLRPGGLAAFQEIDYSGARSSEFRPLLARCQEWIVTTFRKLGANPEMGLHLHQTFQKAGLPRPHLCLDALIGSGEEFVGFKLAESLVETLLPAMLKLRVADPGEVDMKTLKKRLVAESLGSVVVLPSLIGAWARLPLGS